MKNKSELTLAGTHAMRPLRKFGSIKKKGMSSDMFQISDKNYKWWITATMGLIIFILCVDWTIVSLAIPTIAVSLHSTLSQIQWILSGYAMTSAMFMILGGKLADHYGKRFIMVLGVFIFTISVGIAGIAPNEWVLIICRGIQGIGASFSLPLAILFIFKAFPKNQRGFAIGIVGSIAGFSLALGPTLGGFILHWLSWRWVFFVNVPVGVLCILLSICVCRKDDVLIENRGIDFIGVFILMLGLLGITLSLNEAHNWGFSWLFFGCLIGGLFCLVVLYFVEKRIAIPLIDLEVLKNKSFIYSSFIRMFIQYFFGAFIFIIVLYLQNILSYSPMKSGLLLLFTTLIIAFTSPFSGRMVDKIGGNRMVALGTFVMSVACLLFARLGLSPSIAALAIPLFLMGVGVSIAMPGTTNVALSSISDEQSNVATAIFYTVGFLGGTIGVAMTGLMLSGLSFQRLQAELTQHVIKLSKSSLEVLFNVASGSHPVSRLTNYFSDKSLQKITPIVRRAFLHAYSDVMLVCAFLMLLSLFLVLWLMKLTRQEQ